MNISALITATNDRLQDSIPTLTLLMWFEDAQNKLATQVEAVFPSLVNPDGTQSTILEPVWDRRFHDLLVIYACARYRESDEAMNEAQYLDSLFHQKLMDAVVEMEIPIQYQNKDNTQQFIATAGQTVFTITKETFYQTYGSIRVFVKGSELIKKSDFKIVGNAVTLNTVVCAANDLVSIVWDTPYIYNFPPQQFQGSW